MRVHANVAVVVMLIGGLVLLTANPSIAQTTKPAADEKNGTNGKNGTTAVVPDADDSNGIPMKPAAAKKLTVAILDFDARSAGDEALGAQVADMLNAAMTQNKQFTLVERATITKAISEQAAGLSGLIDPEQAAKVGKLLGAKILVTGKVFPLDKNLCITAKIIGTETGEVDSLMVKGPKEGDVGKLVDKLAVNLQKRVTTSGARIVSGAAALEPEDPIPGLQKKLEGKKLPKIAVGVEERHMTAVRETAPDPAVDTEIRWMLQQCGFEVVEGDEKVLAEEQVEMVVSGEAFSEQAARIGDMTSCNARVELKLKNRNGGKILFTDRTTSRAVDLSENIAAKTALQKAGHELGIRLIEHLAKTLPKDDGAQPDAKKQEG